MLKLDYSISMTRKIRNLYQRYTNVFGISSSITSSIISHIGYHPSYKIKNLKQTFLFYHLNKFLREKEPFISSSYTKFKTEEVLRRLKARDYQANRMRTELPVRGQRRRTNARTVKYFMRRLKSSSRR